MQSSETVYEFGSPSDEDEDDRKKKQQSRNNNDPLSQQQHQQQQLLQQQQQRLINNEISASEEQLLIKGETSSSGGADGGPSSLSNSNLLGRVGSGACSISNMSNTSLSSATNSSRGNMSQSGGNQSGVSVSSQKSLGHQQSSVSSQQQNPNFDSNVISERVKNLATQIYQELKRIISRCNYDEDILSGLMPLIVRVLESLDLALIENQQLQVELELCKDDNEQLVIMFDKEKAAKRAIDKKLIESDYAYEEERQQYQQKIESLDNVVKMHELKAKNASDQATRFEEKEAERKKEYHKLHDRYTELLKSHCDIVERFRQLAGSSEIANLNVPHQMVASSSDLTVGELHPHPLNKLKLSHDDEFHDKNIASVRPRDTLKTWNADTELTLEDASLVVIDDMVEASSHHNKVGDGSSHNESDRATSEPGEGEHEKESENDSIAYTSMEKEFRKLIQENKDLLNTKNALNVVKDDLIAEVDRLTNEVSMYEQAIEQLNSTKDQMKHKVSALDAELRKTKEELEKAKQKIRESNEEGVPYSQRKRFGRAEMAKVLMERNNYKERFMELQDAVRYTELVRANRIETEKRSGLWKFFSNLFGAPPPPPTRAIMGSPRDSSPVVAYSSSTGGTSVGMTDRAAAAANQMVAADALQMGASGGRASTTGSIWSSNQRFSGSGSDCIVLMDSDSTSVDRANRAGSRESGGGGASADASGGYIHAYGWSLRASSIKGLNSESNSLVSSTNQNASGGASRVSPSLGGTSNAPTSSNADSSQSGETTSPANLSSKLASLQVPIPQYCRPLTGDSLGMKIWCATAIDLSGGDLSKCTRANIVEVSSEQDTSSSTLGAVDSGANNTSGSLVNISTSTPIKSKPGQNERALRNLERNVSQALEESADYTPVQNSSSLSSSSNLPLLKTTTEMVLSALPFADDVEELSTCVWICSTQHSRSKITIIDMKNKPNELLDSFYVPTFLYCIKSIPGCKPSDLLGLAASISESSTQNSQDKALAASASSSQGITLGMISELIANQRDEFYKLVQVDPKAQRRLRRGRIEVDKILREQVNTSAPAGAAASLTQQDDNMKELISEAIIELASSDAEPVRCGTKVSQRIPTAGGDNDDDAEISRLLENTSVTDGIATLQKLNDFVAHTQPTGLSTSVTEASKVVSTDEQISAGGAPKSGQASSGRSSAGDSDTNKDATSASSSSSHYEPISTHLSTVWMGGKDCVLYIHSAHGQWKDCVACVELPDSILQICHYRARAFVALADGSLCVFFRNIDTKQWDFSQYLLINVGLMNEVTGDSLSCPDDSDFSSPLDTHSRLTNLILDNDDDAAAAAAENRSNSGGGGGGSGEDGDSVNYQSPAHTRRKSNASQQNTSPNRSSLAGDSARRSTTPTHKRRGKVSGVHCLEIANKNLWLGHRNRVLIFEPITMRLKHTFNVVPQVDNQIRQMVSMKDGVFICLRSDLTLRLYSSLRPYQHIQNIDIEPVVTRLISPKTFVISHITSMRVAENTLWIGIAHGIILTIPCKLVPQISEAPMRNSLTGEFEESPSHLSIARFVPKCDVNNAQVSFHGHRDAVKFFINAHNLMLSGGQGYLDFRLDMDDQSKTISDKSHLILWQLPSSSSPSPS